MKKVIMTLFLLLVAVTCAAAQSDVHPEPQCKPNNQQSKLSLHVEVPAFIETGLTDGSMQRVGGIIRNTDNQQTIALLRQGGQVGQVTESASGLLEHIIKLSGQEGALGSLLASAAPILGISMAGFSLIEHIVGIRAHEEELERIYDRVGEEFQRDREIQLFSALAFAETIVNTTNEDYKAGAVVPVLFALTEAREQLLWDLDELLDAENTKANADLAFQYQVLAMKVCAMSARLHLDIGDTINVTNGLSKCVQEQAQYVKAFVRSWIDSPVIYFHESVSDEYFDRFLAIERWLRGKRAVLAELARENRVAFWDEDAISRLFAQIWGQPRLAEPPFYASEIPRAEKLIENFQRLQGYELELASMCQPSFSEWEATDSQHDGYVMLVDGALLAGG